MSKSFTKECCPKCNYYEHVDMHDAKNGDCFFQCKGCAHCWVGITADDLDSEAKSRMDEALEGTPKS